MISNSLPFFHPYVSFSFFFSCILSTTHVYHCPHPLLFLFLYFHSSTFQKLLILSSLSFFPLLPLDDSRSSPALSISSLSLFFLFFFYPLDSRSSPALSITWINQRTEKSKQPIPIRNQPKEQRNHNQLIPMRNQPKEHTEKSLPKTQTTIQNYRNQIAQISPQTQDLWDQKR